MGAMEEENETNFKLVSSNGHKILRNGFVKISRKNLEGKRYNVGHSFYSSINSEVKDQESSSTDEEEKVGKGLWLTGGPPGWVFQHYRKFGQYWNVFPKTDFTYSPSSPLCGKTVAPGIPIVPNMSRHPLRRMQHSFQCLESSCSENTYEEEATNFLRNRRMNRFQTDEVVENNITTETIVTQESNNNNLNHYHHKDSQKILEALVPKRKYWTTYLAPKRWCLWFILFPLIFGAILFLLYSKEYIFYDDGEYSENNLAKEDIRFFSWLSEKLLLNSFQRTFEQGVIFLKDSVMLVPVLISQVISLIITTIFFPFQWIFSVLSSSREGRNVGADTFRLSDEDLQLVIENVIKGMGSRGVLKNSDHEVDVSSDLDNKIRILMNSQLNSKIEEILSVRLNTEGSRVLNTELLSEIDGKLKKMENYYKDFLVDVKGQFSNSMKDKIELLQNQLKQWKIVFDGLETKLKELEQRENMSSLLTTLSANLNSFQAKQLVEYLNSKSQADGTSLLLPGLEEYILGTVEKALLKYHADRTGLADYALLSNGGYIVSTKCTVTYPVGGRKYVYGIPLWDLSTTPETILKPGVMPGECWAFVGSEGSVVIKLAEKIRINLFTMEHTPRELTPFGQIDSAPKDFSVKGLKEDRDENPIDLGTFKFLDNSQSLQQFEAVDYPEGVDLIELKIQSNHGHPEYTCLYRFRVHGNPVAG